MVNENQGKVYRPKPVYNRKLLRSVIRAEIVKRQGRHKVSETMSEYFRRTRKAQVN